MKNNDFQLISTRSSLALYLSNALLIVLLILSTATGRAFALDTVVDTSASLNQANAPASFELDVEETLSKSTDYPLVQIPQKKLVQAVSGDVNTASYNPAEIPAPELPVALPPQIKPAAINTNVDLPKIQIKTLTPAQYPTAEVTLPEKPTDYRKDTQFNKIVINLPSRTLWLFHKDEIVRFFPVAVGRKGFPTPVGEHQVIRKIRNPGWENPYKPSGASRIAPGSNNPLGTRWIGFKADPKGEYGMHGTDNPSSVGKFASHGCVRMKIPDAETLFDLIDYKTPVDVTYEQILVRDKHDEILLIPYADYYGWGRPTFKETREKILKKYPTAQLDDAKIQAALNNPNERPIVVGKIMPPPQSNASRPEPMPALAKQSIQNQPTQPE